MVSKNPFVNPVGMTIAAKEKLDGLSEYEFVIAE
jgi:hypothetical protein